MFGAGVAGAIIAAKLPLPVSLPLMEVPVYAPSNGLGAVIARKLYRSNAGTVFKLIATIEDNTTRTYTDKMTGFQFDNLPIFGDGLPVPGDDRPLNTPALNL